MGRLAGQIRVLGPWLGTDPPVLILHYRRPPQPHNEASVLALTWPPKPPSWLGARMEGAERGKKACSWMCSGVRRGGEANNAIRELREHTHTHTNNAMLVFIYRSSSHTDGDKGRKGREQNGEGQKQKGGEEKREKTGEVEELLQRWREGETNARR